MILLDGSPFFEVKRRLAINQYWKAAALIRDVERNIIKNISYGGKIPSKYFKDLDLILKDVKGYHFYNPWIRKIKINSIYAE